MTGYVVVPEVHTVMYVVLSKEEKHVPSGKLVSNHGIYNVVASLALTEVVTTELNCTDSVIHEGSLSSSK